MNIISQNISNVLKNRIKNVIETLSNQMVDEIVKVMFTPNEKESYFNLISIIRGNQRDVIIKVIEETLEQYDLYYKNSLLRKKNYIVSKNNLPRIITTTFRELTFKRTYYKSKVNNSLHSLLYEELNLPKCDKYDPIVKSIAINNSIETSQKKSGEIIGQHISSLKQSLSKFTTKTISRQSIHNCINNWIIPKFNYPER